METAQVDFDTTVPAAGLSAEQLEDLLREIGARRYHNLHPFHTLLHGGKLSKTQVQAWALNRYYYQSMIPRKDTALMSKMEDRELRLRMAAAAISTMTASARTRAASSAGCA